MYSELSKIFRDYFGPDDNHNRDIPVIKREKKEKQR